MTVTTPQGGTVHYDFTSQTLDPQLPDNQVVSSRVLGGRDVPPATWTFSYSPPNSTHFGSYATAQGPQNISLFYEHEWSGVATPAFGVGWVVKESKLSVGSTVLSDLRRDYQNFRYLPWQTSGTVAVPTFDTLVQPGQTYTTRYDYAPDDGDHQFADFHRPSHVTSTGQLTKTMDTAYEYGFSGLYLLNRTRSETVAVNGESFTKSYGYEASTGFLSVQRDGLRRPTGDAQAIVRAQPTPRQSDHDCITGACSRTRTREYVTREITDGTVASETRGGVRRRSHDAIGRTTLVRAPIDEVVTDYTD